ncbi:MAG: nuclear transport factor 2 family protein [Bacteroidota bacterium]|nr:DUF4440 domain-containing protein [Odoribacter sp.]MDP3645301.1 nuclear transport factor 2 family protein [Bacteroidota bacterium]
MKKKNHSGITAACVALSLFVVGFSASAGEKTAEISMLTEQVTAKSDLAKIKAEIQALENSWAAADNARNSDAVAAFYADDAVSLANNKPMVVGKAAIKKDIEANMAKRAKGSTVSYDILDVFGNENTVTEVGKSTVKDEAGKVTSTGKYMAVWEKRNGKYVCIRDIYNEDVKEK